MYQKTIPAIKLDQSIKGIIDRPVSYIFQLEASELLKIATVSTRIEINEDKEIKHVPGGFQRLLKQKRCKEINEFVREKYGFLPGNIILSFPNKSLEFIPATPGDLIGDLTITIDNKKAFLIDGQHRLFAFDNDNNPDNIDIPFSVTAYQDLTEEEMASIFRAINEKQQKINKSLIYDLIPSTKFRNDDYPTTRGQAIAEILNRTKKEMYDSGDDYDISALSQRLYIDGRRNAREQPINLSAAVTIFAKKYLDEAERRIFTQNGFKTQDVQVRIMINCLNAFRDRVGHQFWLSSKDSIFTQSVGITGLLEIIPSIIEFSEKTGMNTSNDSVPSKEDFDKIFEKLFPDINKDKKDIFSPKTYKDYTSFRKRVDAFKVNLNKRINEKQ